MSRTRLARSSGSSRFAAAARRAAERLEAGEPYAASGYAAADELGRRVHPEWYSDEYARLPAAGGVPGIRLHDARHS
jgi:integrase